MIAELIMSVMAWTDAWFPRSGEHFSRGACYVGKWTGPDNDLLCVKHCDTNGEAERWLSPPGRTMLHAAVLSGVLLATGGHNVCDPLRVRVATKRERGHDASQALLAVVDALPKCTCGAVATLADHGPDGVSEYTCDACAPSSLAQWNDHREQAIAELRAMGASPGDDDPGPLVTLTDLPYAAALRALAGGAR